MPTSLNYIVENIEASYEIYKEINNMEVVVLGKLQKGIEESYNYWLGDDWELFEETNLQNDQTMGVLNGKLRFKVEGDKVDSIGYFFELIGDDPIWKMYGLNGGNDTDMVHAILYLTPLLKLEHGQKIIKDFDDKYLNGFKERGCIRKGNRKNPYYMIDISLSNKAILKGLENDDWEEALEPLKKAWTSIHELIDWDDLGKQIHKN